MTTEPGSRRATVILCGLCGIAASAVVGAALYRYMFWGGQLPGGVAINPVDVDGGGSPEYLIVKAAVDLPESGDYTAVAVLLDPSTGNALSSTSGRVEMDRGTDIFSTGFWAPEIRKAEVSGPYSVRLTFIREQSDSIFERSASPDMVGRVYQWTFSTPAYDWRSFQAQASSVSIDGAVATQKHDVDGDGLADAYSLSIPVTVQKNGFYSVRAESKAFVLPGVTDRFFPAGTDLGAPQFVQMAPGERNVEITVPADQVYLSGVDGPTDIHITVATARDTVTTHPCCGTVDETFSEEPTTAPAPDGSVFGLRQPYVLPRTPLGSAAEAHVSEALHWYEFKGPWMPIEFAGNVQDHGTDTDGNGVFDYLTVQADVHVRSLGSYDLSGTLYAGGSEPSNQILMRSTPDSSRVVTTAWTRISFSDWSQTQGTQTVRLDFAGAEILAAGLSGPYDVKLRIVPAQVIIDPVVAHTTAAYDLSQFEATGAKVARLPSVIVTPSESGTFDVRLAGEILPSGSTVTVRIIHANGVVALESVIRSGQTGGVSFHTDRTRASGFAVAVYLTAPSGDGVDYIEVPLSTT